MKELLITFKGKAAEAGRDALYSWLVDGGGEDVIIDALDRNDLDSEISDCDNGKHEIVITVSKASGKALLV